MPSAIATLAQEMLKNPMTLNLARKAAPATGITQAVYPVPQDLKTSLLVKLLNQGGMNEALVFTRTKHRANRLAEQLGKQKINVARIHGNRSQAQRTDALDGFKSGRYRVLVATDIAARGIDVEALGHVVNFDVPLVPEDYIHRVGRTARAEMTGDAFTFVAPNEESDLRAIEQAIGKRLPRVTVPDFDYTARASERFEVPLADRIAEIRKRKADERQRARANAERRAANAAVHAPRAGGASHARPAGGSGQPGSGHRAHGRPGGQPGGGGGGQRPGHGPARGGSFGPRRPGSGSGPRRGGNR
jgi:ATP-dependent RNA helicase RhlE